MLNTHCPVCLNNENYVIRPYLGHSSLFNSSVLKSCIPCGMVFADPLPSQQDLAEYNSKYFDSAHGGHSSNKISLAFYSGIALLRISFIKCYLNKRGITASNILEVGPGMGYLAKNWLRLSPNTKYSALESDPSCYQALQDLGIRLVEADEVQVVKDHVDLVVMSHVLEHVSDPFSFISSMTQGLCSGGVLFIEVPCQDWLHKSEDEPHILFFEKPSMEYLLKRLGFVDIEMGYFGLEISKLKSPSFLKKVMNKVRNKLIAIGVTTPFSRAAPGMEDLHDPLERAVVAPFLAHIESSEPAWWLRVIARKP